MRAASTVPWVALLALLVGVPDDSSDIPGKIHKLLEMDKIPAIKDPKFVAADEAKIPDGHRMIGVVIDGDARAYCPNILNHHEIVNDEVGGRKVAVTW